MQTQLRPLSCDTDQRWNGASSDVFDALLCASVDDQLVDRALGHCRHGTSPVTGIPGAEAPLPT